MVFFFFFGKLTDRQRNVQLGVFFVNVHLSVRFKLYIRTVFINKVHATVQKLNTQE